jgi:glutathione peroxidase
MSQFYTYTVPTAHGEEKSMDDFKGKVVLVVNTATG